MAIGEAVKGADQAGEILPRLRSADGQDIARHPRREEGFHERPGHGRCERGQERHARCHHPYPGGVGPECVDHLAGHERRVRVDPGATPQGTRRMSPG